MVGALRDGVLDLGLLAHLVYLVFFWCFGKGGNRGRIWSGALGVVNKIVFTKRTY